MTPDLRNVGARVIVQSCIVPAGGTPNELSYVMRQGPSGWKAVGVLADGSISRVSVQRSDFRSLLDNGGAPALVAGLERTDLCNGAATGQPRKLTVMNILGRSQHERVSLYR